MAVPRFLPVTQKKVIVVDGGGEPADPSGRDVAFLESFDGSDMLIVGPARVSDEFDASESLLTVIPDLPDSVGTDDVAAAQLSATTSDSLVVAGSPVARLANLPVSWDVTDTARQLVLTAVDSVNADDTVPPVDMSATALDNASARDTWDGELIYRPSATGTTQQLNANTSQTDRELQNFKADTAIVTDPNEQRAYIVWALNLDGAQGNTTGPASGLTAYVNNNNTTATDIRLSLYRGTVAGAITWNNMATAESGGVFIGNQQLSIQPFTLSGQQFISFVISAATITNFANSSHPHLWMRFESLGGTLDSGLTLRGKHANNLEHIQPNMYMYIKEN